MSKPDRSRYFQAMSKDCVRNSGSVMDGQRPQGTEVPVRREQAEPPSATQSPSNTAQQNAPRHGTRSRPVRWKTRNLVVPTSLPRSALKGPVLVPRARGFLIEISRLTPDYGSHRFAKISWGRLQSARSSRRSRAYSYQARANWISRCRSAPSDAAARFIAASASCCGSYLIHMRPNSSRPSGQAHGNFVRMIAG